MSAIKTEITNDLSLVNLTEFSLMERIKNAYRDYTDKSQFLYLFSTRNKLDAVKPFLDSLEAPYLIVTPELIVVDINPTVDDKLIRLGFVSTVSICPTIPYFKKLLKVTKDLFTDRIYHSGYNFELYLVEPQDWDKIHLTKAIVDDLKTKDDMYFHTFIKVYNRLKKTKAD